MLEKLKTVIEQFYSELSQETPYSTNSLLWSGGQDSTLMMYAICEAANRWCVDNGKHSKITIKYYCFKSNRHIGKHKMRREKLARVKLKAIFEYTFKHVTLEEVKIDLDSLPTVISYGRNSQAALWALVVLFADSTDSKINIGAIGSDDNSDIKTQKDTFYNLAKIIGKDGFCSLNYPLLNFTRKEVTSSLTGLGLIDYTTWCESQGKKDNCGECLPCRSHVVEDVVLG